MNHRFKRASLAIFLLLVTMPTVAQAQSEFEGTFRCTLINVMEAFRPDGRLRPIKAEERADFRNFTIDYHDQSTCSEEV
jgi:hypothetical protein